MRQIVIIATCFVTLFTLQGCGFVIESISKNPPPRSGSTPPPLYATPSDEIFWSGRWRQQHRVAVPTTGWHDAYVVIKSTLELTYQQKSYKGVITIYDGRITDRLFIEGHIHRNELRLYSRERVNLSIGSLYEGTHVATLRADNRKRVRAIWHTPLSRDNRLGHYFDR